MTTMPANVNPKVWSGSGMGTRVIRGKLPPCPVIYANTDEHSRAPAVRNAFGTPRD
jgi:hypothetical protein